MFRYLIVGLSGLIIASSSPQFRLLQAAGKEKAIVNRDESRLYTAKLPDSIIIDSIAVHKHLREMQVFSKNKLVKIYRVRLGLNPVGSKQIQGDYKTPEGHYYISSHNQHSMFHKSLGISYPNSEDIARARRMGRSPGGDIVIHGLPNRDAWVGPDRYQNDWTWGCIALRNEEIDELFAHVRPGTPILITP